MKLTAKRILCFLSIISVHSLASAAGQVQLTVPNGGEIPNNNLALIVPISGAVLNNVGYNIICHVNNMNKFTIISSRGLYCAEGKKVNPTCVSPDNSIIINGKAYTQPNPLDYFKGDNIVEKPAVAVIDSDTTGALVFAMQTNPFAEKTTVTSCVAVPVN